MTGMSLDDLNAELEFALRMQQEERDLIAEYATMGDDRQISAHNSRLRTWETRVGDWLYIKQKFYVPED